MGDDSYRKRMGDEAIEKSKVFELSRVGKQWMDLFNRIEIK